MARPKTSKLGKKPNWFFYRVLGMGLALRLGKIYFRIRIKPDKAVCAMDGPLICIGNHPSYIDPLVVAALLKKRYVNFVAGAFLFRIPIFGALIAGGGCIPKTQYHSDSQAVKAMVRVLKRKGTLALFPEATRMVDGTSIPFNDSLARLIKRSGSSVAIIASRGAYSTWPRWSTSGIRRGRIEGQIKRVITSDEVAKLEVDQLHRILLSEMAYNEYDWLKNHPHNFKSNAIAESCHNVAHACPKCELLVAMKSEGNHLFCTHCGNRAIMDKSGFLTGQTSEDRVFSTLHAWVAWQKEQMEKRVLDPSFCIDEATYLLLPWGDFAYRLVGCGRLLIRGNKVIYKGGALLVEDGITYTKKTRKKAARKNLDLLDSPKLREAKSKTISFDIGRIRGVSADYGKRMELVDPDGRIYRFMFEDGQKIFDIQTAILSIKAKLEA